MAQFNSELNLRDNKDMKITFNDLMSIFYDNYFSSFILLPAEYTTLLPVRCTQTGQDGVTGFTEEDFYILIDKIDIADFLLRYFECATA